MAQSVQNSTRLLYSSNDKVEKRVNTTNSTSTFNNSNNNNDYADSPSRQLRRSTRVAALSPSSFTPLISESTMTSSNNSSGSSSTTSSASSYMPASPSRKYSMMRSGYKGVSIDEIVINEPLEEDVNNSKRPAYPTLRSNPDRKHPTLNFQPTNLDTPSTQIHGVKNTGITPSVKQISLTTSDPNIQSTQRSDQHNILRSSHQGDSHNIPRSNQRSDQQNTPAQRILDKLVSLGDMEEIAKATPLANYYNKAKAMMTFGPAVETAPPAVGAKNTFVQNSIEPNNSKSTEFNEMRGSRSTTTTNNNTNNTNNTPKKQIDSTITPSSDAETVKVVRTLRNRSIISSPVPATSSNRRLSTNFNNNPKKPNPNYFKENINVSVFFKKHQKNLLAYSLLAVFLAATIYHIYDGLTFSAGNDQDENLWEVNSGPVALSKDKINFIEKDEVIKLIEEKFVETRNVVNGPEGNVADDIERKIADSIKQNISEDIKRNINEDMKRNLEDVKRNITDDINVKLEEKLSSLVDKFNRQIDSKLNQIQSHQINSKTLDGLTTSIKSLERKFQVLEEAKGKFDVPQAEKFNEGNATGDYVKVSVVKHLTTRPLKDSILFTSPFQPENALSTATQLPFKFKGNRGKLAILLAKSSEKLPTTIQLEHPPMYDRSCAPRDFEIWGLPNILNERDSPKLLLKATFDPSTKSQQFKLKPNNQQFKVIQLRIRNNYGNQKFTCLYKFKVLNK